MKFYTDRNLATQSVPILMIEVTLVASCFVNEDKHAAWNIHHLTEIQHVYLRTGVT